MKKKKSIIALVVWFLWAAGQDLDSIARFSIKSDYYIYSDNHLAPLFFVFSFTIFLLNVSTVYYLFRPYYAGFYTGLAALCVAASQGILTIFMALSDLPGVRVAYEAGREVRGLPVRQEALDMIFTPNAMYSGLGVMLFLYLLVGYYLVKNKSYFFDRRLPAW
jgi:hypothetical protein